VLEGAIGIDLDTTSACSGNPDACPADPCTEERCPIRNSLVQRVHREFLLIQEDLAYIRHVVDELAKRGQLPQQILEIARSLAHRDYLLQQQQQMEDALAQAPDTLFLQDLLGRTKLELTQVDEQLSVLKNQS
jgi:hypothetical protein